MNIRKVIMCTPQNYGVEYEINPWMDKKRHLNQSLAKRQWAYLTEVLSRLYVNLHIIPQQEKEVPDKVFTANAGLPLPTGDFLLSRFFYKQRRAEESIFREDLGGIFKNILRTPENVFFEGQGDAFFVGSKLFLGYGFRTTENIIPFLRDILPGYEIVPLKLTNKHFYHLDTALLYIGNGRFFAVREAFSEESQKTLKEHGDVFFLSKEDAMDFVANSIVILNKREKHIILGRSSPSFKVFCETIGFKVHFCPMTEFKKSGGSVRCLTLTV